MELQMDAMASPKQGIPSSAAVSDVGSQCCVKFSETLHQLLKLGSLLRI